MMTPPEPVHVAGNSIPVVWAPLPLYCSVAADPKFSAAETVAVPSIERTPVTVGTVVRVTAAVPPRVRLLNVVAEEPTMAWAAPLRITVPVLLLLKVPLFVQFPPKVKEFAPVKASVAPGLMVRLLHKV